MSLVIDPILTCGKGKTKRTFLKKPTSENHILFLCDASCWSRRRGLARAEVEDPFLFSWETSFHNRTLCAASKILVTYHLELPSDSNRPKMPFSRRIVIDMISGCHCSPGLNRSHSAPSVPLLSCLRTDEGESFCTIIIINNNSVQVK